MSNRTLSVSDRLYDYLLTHSLREPPILERLRAETAKLPMARMQISPEQGQFMRLLVTMIGARRTLEIGTFTGYSALSVAMALPPEGRVLACDVSEEYTAIARRYWREAGLADKIELSLSPALETLQARLAAGEARSYDFAFIDADKENYLAYYQLAKDLLRKGGLIAIDNVLWGGAVADPGDRNPDTRAIRELNDFVHQDDEVLASLLPVGDGLTLALKL